MIFPEAQASGEKLKDAKAPYLAGFSLLQLLARRLISGEMIVVSNTITGIIKEPEIIHNY